AHPQTAGAGRAVRGDRPGVGRDHPGHPAALRRRGRLGGDLQPCHGAGRAAVRPRRRDRPGAPGRLRDPGPGARQWFPGRRLRAAGRGPRQPAGWPVVAGVLTGHSGGSTSGAATWRTTGLLIGMRRSLARNSPGGWGTVLALRSAGLLVAVGTLLLGLLGL